MDTNLEKEGGDYIGLECQSCVGLVLLQLALEVCWDTSGKLNRYRCQQLAWPMDVGGAVIQWLAATALTCKQCIVLSQCLFIPRHTGQKAGQQHALSV